MLGGSCLLGACGDEQGRRRLGSESGDSAQVALDSGIPEVPSYGEPVVTGDLACYLGPDSLGDTCLPVVAWDPDWGPDYAYPEPLDAQYAAPLAFLDLEGGADDPDLAVAPTFVLAEFVSARKGRFAVLQTHLVEHLQAVRDDVGGPVLINSGYRSPGYNAGIDGAAEWSRHLYGDAVDIRSGDASLEALADACEAEGASYVAVYTSHVHCDWRDEPLDPVFFPVGPPSRAPEARPVAVLHATADGLQVEIVSGLEEGTPLVRWTAVGSRGDTLATATGLSWTPPTQAHRVVATVGRQVTLQHRVPLSR